MNMQQRCKLFWTGIILLFQVRKLQGNYQSGSARTLNGMNLSTRSALITVNARMQMIPLTITTTMTAKKMMSKVMAMTMMTTTVVKKMKLKMMMNLYMRAMVRMT
jgi:hypothetical protein